MNNATVSPVEKAAAVPRRETRDSVLSPARPACRQGDIILCLVPKGYTRHEAIDGATVQLAHGTTRGSHHMAHLPEGWRAWRADGLHRGPGGSLLANVLIEVPAAGGKILVDHPEHPAHSVTVPPGHDLLACSQIDHASDALRRVRD